MFEDDPDEVRRARESVMIDAMASVAEQVAPTRATWRHDGLRAVLIAVVCGCLAGWLLDSALFPHAAPPEGSPVHSMDHTAPGGR